MRRLNNEKRNITNNNRVHSRRLHTVVVLLLLMATTVTFSGCSEDVYQYPVVGRVIDHYFNKPNQDNTAVGLPAVTAEVDKAIEQGEDHMIVLAASVTDKDIANIAMNMSGYWGIPELYEIIDKYDDIDGIDGTVYKVRYTLKQSNNYYVYNNLVNGKDIPEGEDQAKQIAGSLQGIISAIGLSNDKTNFENARALHDWLVNNIDYDETIDAASTSNGSFGALIGRKTMCQGYAEAMKLLINVATDMDCEIMIGEGDSGTGNYEPHAWNQMKIDGNWYQFDATFDDPVKNVDGIFNHYYFGQSDAVMKLDHNWEAGYFNTCSTDDFIYYRFQGLFADDYASFKTKIQSMLASKAPVMEVAIKGFEVTQSNMQFVFNDDPSIHSINWSSTGKSDIRVVSIAPIR
ncbi:MAG: hypothetical protein LBN22_05335 [Clostridiales Family XIII bacterium]|jgi:hypothetical protein|nr:hypothetical protein [Clostridiales Family XIII bacterium]